MYSTEQEEQLLKKSFELLDVENDISQIEDLREVIRFHEWRYSVKFDPSIGDYEFDQLFKRLEELESAYPESITSDSPTQRITSDLVGDFPKVAHKVAMLSLDNSYDADDLKKFDETVKKLTGVDKDDDIEYTVEPKFDGGSVALVYKSDDLVRGATRGNGVYGEDITANARALRSVPLRTKFSHFDIAEAELRGEAVIRKDRFSILNEEREKLGKVLFANPRNTAAGGLRTKKVKDTRDRKIEVFAFQLGYAVDDQGNDILESTSRHSDQIKLLKQLGFKVPDDTNMVCKNINEVIEQVNEWEGKREAYPYEIDGMVIKVNERRLQLLCGSTDHHPRWAIAFKFKAKQAITILEHVDYQVGKIGSITPVAKVQPVQLAGVTVSSISLHNEEFITTKDLRIGDNIIIERAGDVIPYVVGPIPSQRNGKEIPISFPEWCPVNDTNERIALIKEGGEAAWRCPKCVCGAQDLQRIAFHVSKPAMDIDGFGQNYVVRFYELGWLKDISDVYNLNYESMAQLEGFGQKSAHNLKNSVEKAKKNPISRLLHSLSIHHLGKKASKLIAQEIDHVLDLIEWGLDDFTRIKDIGPVVAKNVVDFFQDESNVMLLKRMEERGVNLDQTEEDKPLKVEDDAPLIGKTILFTGSLQKMTRNEAKKLAEKAGAKNISAVSSNLNILVVGEKAGSKLTKAKDIGTVDIWTEEEFLTKLENT